MVHDGGKLADDLSYDCGMRPLCVCVERRMIYARWSNLETERRKIAGYRVGDQGVSGHTAKVTSTAGFSAGLATQ